MIVLDETNDQPCSTLVTDIPDPETLPPVFPLTTANKVLRIGKNQGYELIKAGKYPVRVLNHNGRFKVSRYDLLAYLHAPQAADGAA